MIELHVPEILRAAGPTVCYNLFDMAGEHDINAVIQGMHIADIALKARTDPSKLCQIASFSLSEHFINLILQRVFFDTWPRNRSSKKSPQMCTQIIVSLPYSISDKTLMSFLLSKSIKATNFQHTEHSIARRTTSTTRKPVGLRLLAMC